jgi:hypothetical protein
MDSDRRRTPRVPCDLPVEWRRAGRTLRSRARDLNEHGLFIATEIPGDRHHVMDGVVMMPDGPVEILGGARVGGATRYGHGIGIAIHAISNADRKRWELFYNSARHQMLSSMRPEVARHFGPK